MPNYADLHALREEILDLLQRSPAPMQLLELSKRLRIRSNSEEYEYLRDVLTKMAEEGLVNRHSRRRYSLAKRDQAGFTGTLTLYHESATVETGDPDFPVIHVRRQHLYTALDGDVVTVKPHALRDGKKIRGEVTSIVERSPHPIAGTIEYDGSFFYLIPDESKYYVDFLVSEKRLNGAKPGDKVAATFVRWEHANASPEAEVTEVLGQSGRAIVEFNAILREFGLPVEFPKPVEQEAAQGKPPAGRVPRGRTDLRQELIITIDPDDARDFDDALSLRKLKNGNVELGVHIADVSHYVKPGTALDTEALRRGNSTYLVDRVVPMLPEHLSNDVCSLVPNKNRMAFTVFMEFSPRGVRKKHRIEETVIKSKHRFTYDQVQQIIDGADHKHRDLVLSLHSLAQMLYKKRMKTGGIDFETQEVKFLLDENKMPVGSVVKTRTDATSLVEECMLAANRTVAEHLESLRKEWRKEQTPPLVYRIHEEPDQDKIQTAVGVVRAMGVDVPNGKLTPQQINAILKKVEDRPEKQVVHTLFLRSMSKAVYAETNVGHYGLGFEAYAHFTSPIRRYPDLFVHRALKEYAKGVPDRKRWKELNGKAADVSDHTSITEREAVDAERASVKLAQTILAREHVGEEYEGYVNGVTSFGVFVMLDGLNIEGLLHIKDLDDDYYLFEEDRFRLVGRRRKRILQFGSRLKVRIARADVEKRLIDLALVRESRKASTRDETAESRKPDKKTGTKKKAQKKKTVAKKSTPKKSTPKKTSGTKTKKKSPSTPKKKATKQVSSKKMGGRSKRRSRES